MIVAALFAAALAAPDSAAPSKTAQEHLQSLHFEEAANWRMAVGDGDEELARLNPTPIFSWTNPTKNSVQSGTVFVWLWHGRPVVIGTVFSHPDNGRRVICHEFHSLCPERLRPRRAGGKEAWAPRAVVTMEALPGAEAPESSPARRLVQMRALGREFSAHSIDYKTERWELRMLAQPLYRYHPAEGEIIDGALFGFVTSAGTDPEIILALEARHTSQGERWFYRLLRFSDASLYVKRGGAEVWSSVRDAKNQMWFNPDHTYRLFRDTFIDEIPELKK